MKTICISLITVLGATAHDSTLKISANPARSKPTTQPRMPSSTNSQAMRADDDLFPACSSPALAGEDARAPAATFRAAQLRAFWHHGDAHHRIP